MLALRGRGGFDLSCRNTLFNPTKGIEMDEALQKLESVARASPEYKRALELLDERERLERQIQAVDHEMEGLAVAGQLARIDRLRKALLASTKVFALAG